MKLEERIEYQTGTAEFGIGKVTAYNAETEIVTVIDEDDGSTWRGPADLTAPIGVG